MAKLFRDLCELGWLETTALVASTAVIHPFILGLPFLPQFFALLFFYFFVAIAYIATRACIVRLVKGSPNHVKDGTNPAAQSISQAPSVRGFFVP
jgi:hypothetical protein